METVDEEFLASALDFMDRAHAQEKPFFLWFSATRMHIWTHLKPASQGVTGLGIYPDGMVEHDGQVGQLLDKLDELGIADTTMVMYSTDNGAEEFTWPDGGTTPFRGEKNENWEGGYRIPLLVRWPGVIEPGTVSNDIISHMDWMPTIAAAVGVPDLRDQLLTGYTAGDKTFKVHLDGYNFLPYLKGEAEESPRKEFFYFSDTGDLLCLRYQNWKVVFAEQRAEGFDVWSEPFVFLRLPKLFNLRTDPFERADHVSSYYDDWLVRHAFVFVPAQTIVGAFLSTFKEFPPRQTPASFTIDQVMDQMLRGAVSQ
jgi:arylsulfatase